MDHRNRLHWVQAWSDMDWGTGRTEKTACGRPVDVHRKCATSDRDFAVSPDGRCRLCWRVWRNAIRAAQ